MSGMLIPLSRSTVLALSLCLAAASAASAQDTALQITAQGGRFQPAELQAPANKPIIITIRNNEDKAIEFESVSLRVEKVIAAKSQGSVRIRPLGPGRYEFFDDFNKSNRGTLVVQ